MINIRPVEKQDLCNPEILKVHSIFLTLQGEAIFAGQRAVFVRLAGCNLQCPHCDTDYTSTSKEINFKDIAIEVSDLWHTGFNPAHKQEPLVVITGGEPFRQNLQYLIEELQNYGFTVQIETNGTLFQDNIFDNIDILNRQLKVVCSPKTGTINKKLLPHIDAFKYVVRHDNVDERDGLPLKALDHPAHPILARPPKNHRAKIFIQPEDSKDAAINAANTQTAVNSALNFGYALCLQIHKLVNLD